MWGDTLREQCDMSHLTLILPWPFNTQAPSGQPPAERSVNCRPLTETAHRPRPVRPGIPPTRPPTVAPARLRRRTGAPVRRGTPPADRKSPGAAPYCRRGSPRPAGTNVSRGPVSDRCFRPRAGRADSACGCAHARTVAEPGHAAATAVAVAGGLSRLRRDDGRSGRPPHVRPVTDQWPVGREVAGLPGPTEVAGPGRWGVRAWRVPGRGRSRGPRGVRCRRRGGRCRGRCPRRPTGRRRAGGGRCWPGG